MIKTSILALAFAALLAAAPAFAASAAKTVPAAPAAAAPALEVPDAPDVKPAVDDKKMKSKKCSMAADKQGLHGKMRKKFREDCKKAA